LFVSLAVAYSRDASFKSCCSTKLKSLNVSFMAGNIQEEIKSRMKSGYACYHSVQTLLSSSLLSKYIEMKVHINIILPVVSMGVKLGRS